MNNKIYCYPKCSTCRNAVNYLDENKVSYEYIDIKTNTPNVNELKNIIENSNIDINKFFNTSGLVYKNLKLKSKLPNISDLEKIELLASNGMLIKRPLLIINNKILLGFKIEEYEKAIK